MYSHNDCTSILAYRVLLHLLKPVFECKADGIEGKWLKSTDTIIGYNITIQFSYCIKSRLQSLFTIVNARVRVARNNKSGKMNSNTHAFLIYYSSSSKGT